MSALPCSLVIHASELAACIGKNRFKAPQEMVALYLERLGLAGAKNQYVERNHLPAPQATEAAQAAGELRSVNAAPLDTAGHAVLATVLSVLQGDERQADQLIHTAREAIEHFGDSSAAASSVSDFIAAESQKTQTTLNALVSSGIVSAEKAETMKNEYVSRISKSYGRACEEDVVDCLCRERGWRIDRSQHDTYRKRFVLRTDHGVDVYVGGKIDGFLCDPGSGQRKAVLEVKNRVSRLFRRVYEYERVQVLAYMYINDMLDSPGVLVERHGRSDIMAHVVPYDAMFWQDTVVPGVRDFVRLLHEASSCQP